MFDSFRNQYQLRCPTTGTSTWVSVSDFRLVKRLRGAEHPAVFRVQFDCTTCTGRHESLVSHDHLDWEPLGTESTMTFTNLLTGARELAGHELADLAGTMIKSGSWPWTFWCHPESTLRPGFPSSLRMVAPAHDHISGSDRLGVLVRCFACQRLSVNLVTRAHLDVPYFNDDRIATVEQVFDRDQLSTEEAFRHQLGSTAIRSRWLSAG